MPKLTIKKPIKEKTVPTITEPVCAECNGTGRHLPELTCPTCNGSGK